MDRPPSLDSLIERLLLSDEPARRYKIRLHILEEDLQSGSMLQLQQEIRTCNRVKKLLSRRDGLGRISAYRDTESKWGVYNKWQGAHWIMATLAD